MALTQTQKNELKADWETLISLVEKFSQGDTKTLYVVDKEPLLRGADAIGRLVAVMPRASWTRGKQGHGKKKR
jgi:hypothetical protein